MSTFNNFCFTLLAKDPAKPPSYASPLAAVPLAKCLGLGQLSWLQSGGLRRSQGGRKENKLEAIRSESDVWSRPCAAGVIPDDGGG